MSTPVRIALGAAALAATVVVGLVYIAPGIDPLHSLAWGNVLADGVRPKLTSQLTPLSHPLPIVVSVPLSAFGAAGSLDAYSIVAAGCVALLLYAIWRLARGLARERNAGRTALLAGGLAVLLVLLRPRFELYALQGVVEIPFTALVILAVAHVIDDPRERPLVSLGLLALAGLLRPEAWLLALLYAAWLAREGTRGRELAMIAAAALAGPVLWLSFDAIVASDPLQSIDPSKPERDLEDVGFLGAGATHIAERDADSGPADIFPGTVGDEAVSYFRTLTGDPLAIIGLLVVAAALLPWPERLRAIEGRWRFAVAAGALVLLTAQNLILAALGLPLVERYLFTPALILVVIASAAVWLIPERRWSLAAAGALLLLVVAVSPQKPKEALEKPGTFKGLRSEQEELLALATLGEVDTAVHSGCGRIGVGGRNRSRIIAARPVVAISLDLDLPRVKILRAPRGKHNQSNFRRDLPTGPPPYLERGVWVYRSECLPGGEPPSRKGSKGGTVSPKSAGEPG